MAHRDIQKELDKLGIINVEACGELSPAILEDAIDSTQELLQSIDLDAICDEINEKASKL